MKKGPLVGHVQHISRLQVAMGCTLGDLDVSGTTPLSC